MYFKLGVHCVTCIRIWRFSGQYFPACGLNMEIYSVNADIHSKAGKKRSRKTPSTDAFHVVINVTKPPAFICDF